MTDILSNPVLWIYVYEIPDLSALQITFRQMAGGPALFRHRGTIHLTDSAIYIEGDENLSIPSNNINEMYLGFDERYRSEYVKNFGLFWKPLRLDFYENGSHLERIYLHIYHLGFWNINSKWYDAINSVASSE